MGSYATTTSISINLPGYLKGNTTSSDTPGTALFSGFITDAESKVNAALANRYSMPFSTIPPLLRSLSMQIACYYAVRGGFSVEGIRRNQYLDDYKEAMDTLKELRDGTMKLTYTDGSLVPVNSSGRITSSTLNYTPIFGLDDPRVWQRDEDEISDQEDARE